MFSASDNCLLNNSTRHAIKFSVSETTGVAVRRLMNPSQFGARPSSTKISAIREGTISVGFNEVVIDIIAPSVTTRAAPHGKYTEATSVIGAALAPKRGPGNTPNATADIAMKINAVAVTPFKNTKGKRRVLSFVSLAVWARDSNPA